MGLFILRFWPVLLPLVAYFIWMKLVRDKARKAGEPVPRFREGPLFWTIISMLCIAVLMFMWIGFHNTAQKGDYTPAKLENGRIVPGTVNTP